MNLREDGDCDELKPDGSCPRHTAPTISEMFSDSALVTNTIVPSCGPRGLCAHDPLCPDAPWQNYSHSEIVNVLSALVQMYQPSVIRTLDSQPFEKLSSDGYEVSFDNLDHTAASRYVDEVLAHYHGPNGSESATVVHYKGLSSADYPYVLGTEDYAFKTAVGKVYQQYDTNYQTFQDSYTPIYHVMYERYPGSTSWMEKASNGRLVAVSVEDRQIKMWAENTVGGSWSDPIALNSGGPIAPHLTLLKRPAGMLQIFALRIPLERERWNPPVEPPYQDVITSIQISSPEASFGPWQNIGSPDRGQFNGVPTAAFDGSGRIFLLAKNSDGRVARTFFANNSWSVWSVLDVNSQDIIDGIAAITRNDGIVEVFATSRSGRIQHYVQSGVSFLVDASFPFSGAASAPTVTKNQDGRLEIFFREAQASIDPIPARYGRVLTGYVNTSGQWVGPVVLYGDAGVGPVAAIQRGGSGEIMLFERNRWGGISATRQEAPNGTFILQWNLLDGFLEEYPAAATDSLGRVVVMVKGSDGGMYFRRETSSNSAGLFGPWANLR